MRKIGNYLLAIILSGYLIFPQNAFAYNVNFSEKSIEYNKNLKVLSLDGQLNDYDNDCLEKSNDNSEDDYNNSNDDSNDVNLDEDDNTNEDISNAGDDPEMGHLSVNVKEIKYNDKIIKIKWDDDSDSLSYKIDKMILNEETEEYSIVDSYTVNEKEAVLAFEEYGQAYYYQIQGFDSENKALTESDIFFASLPDQVAKIKTTGVSKTKVKLSWDRYSNATSYYVRYKTSGDEYTELDFVENNSVKIPVSVGLKYTFEVFPVISVLGNDIKGKGKTKTYKNYELVSLTHQKYTYTEMVSDIKGLCAKYSEYVSYNSIGITKEGRQIYDVVLGNPDAKKTILVVSTIHAREYVATVSCMKQLEYYLLYYNKVIDESKIKSVFDEVNVHYIMMGNPDGVSISQNTNKYWKANANGVNLNCNFPYKFKKSGSKKRGTYSGSKAASEKETKAIVSLTTKLNKETLVGVVNYHAAGQIVFGKYKGSNSNVKKFTKKMYDVARKTTGYGDAGHYNDSAGYREYILYKIKKPCITIEVGHSGCPVAKSQYSSIYKKNRLILLREAKLFIS